MGVMPKRNSTLVQFGRNIAHLRNDAGRSQDKLAEKPTSLICQFKAVSDAW